MRSSLMDLRILNEHAVSEKLDLIIQLPDIDGIHITKKYEIKWRIMFPAKRAVCWNKD
jgi:hypothetical protein